MSYQGNNPEGYPDPTANQAVGIVSREEKEAAKAKKQETGRHLPRNGTGSAGSGRIRRGRAYLTGGQP